MVPDSDNDSDDQASSPQQPDGKKQKSSSFFGPFTGFCEILPDNYMFLVSLEK
jgi:hypothetical protein